VCTCWDVAEPGAYDISSLSTSLNALFAAGGLRLVAHCGAQTLPGRQLVEEVDALGFAAGMECVRYAPVGKWRHATRPFSRTSSDRGRNGSSSAIYELHGESSLADVLELAGGILPRPRCAT